MNYLFRLAFFIFSLSFAYPTFAAPACPPAAAIATATFNIARDIGNRWEFYAPLDYQDYPWLVGFWVFHWVVHKENALEKGQHYFNTKVFIGPPTTNDDKDSKITHCVYAVTDDYMIFANYSSY